MSVPGPPSPETVDPLADPAWEALSTGDGASLFTSAPWLATVAATYGLTPKAAVVRAEDGRPRAGLPYFHIRDPQGARVRALPFSDYCDVVGEGHLLDALVAPLTESGSPVTVRLRRARHPSDPPGFREVGRAAWHGVDLTLGADTLWHRLHGSAARNVARARRLGVQVRTSRELEDVRTFHALHCRLRKSKYRLLPQPVAFFEQLHARFSPGDGLRTLLAEWRGEVVAGLLLLRWGGTSYYKFNASVETACRPNDLLTWEAIRQGCDEGLERLDFGLSDLDQPGLIRYKSKFATEEDTITTLAWPDGPTSGESPLGSLLAELAWLLTEPAVPDELTARGGEVLYRYFA